MFPTFRGLSYEDSGARESCKYRHPFARLQSKPARETTPFSIRLTHSERGYLEQKAGNRPLGTYCRERLLGENAEKRIELRQPQLDSEQYASLLAALGQSRLSSKS